jgi:hypothetical protein
MGALNTGPAPEESPSRGCRIRSDMRLGGAVRMWWCESYRQMSRRDCLSVAWHEVPGTARPKRAVPYGMIGADVETDLMTVRSVLG